MPNWSEVLTQIQVATAQHAQLSKAAADLVRRQYLLALHQHTKRNVLAYYSGWLSKPGIPECEINDEDKNGFMMAVHKLDTKLGLDLILHTPGGSIAATESLVDYLHKKFRHDIRAFIPQIAMSAGTMIACSCKEIWMCRHSNIGPIDPHLRGLPAYGVIAEFKRAHREVKRDPSKIPIWQPIIGQYEPTFLSRCDNAIKWSNKFVEDQLATVMFANRQDARRKARQITRKLADFRGNRTHERHISAEEALKIGLEIKMVEDDQQLQDLVLTVHHCFMHALMNTSSFKIIENHAGAAFVKMQQTFLMPQRN